MNTPEMILAKVDKTAGPAACWPWTGYVHFRGYGYTTYKGKTSKAHRLAYEFANNVKLVAEQHVCHLCDNPVCCNPAHLKVDDHAGNMRQRQEKGRQARGSRSASAKVTEADVIEIRWLATQGFTRVSIAKEFKIDARSVSQIVLRQKWKHI